MNIKITKILELAISWITLFIIGTDLFVISPLLPNIQQNFDISKYEASWSVTVFSIMYAIMAPIFGILADKWGKKRNIVVGLIFFALSNFLTFLTPNFVLLLISRIIAGTSASMITSSVFAITGDLAPSSKKGLWLSIATSGFLTSIWIGAPLGNLLSNITNWRTVFLYLSIASIISAILIIFIYPNHINSGSDRQLDAKTLSPIIKDVVVTTFWAFAIYGLYTYLGSALRDINHLNSSIVGIAFVFYGVGALVGSLLGGVLSDRLKNNTLISSTFIGLAIALVLVGITFKNIYLVYPLLTLLGISGYIVFSAFQAFISKRHRETSGSAMSWNQTAMYLGITLSSVVGGILIENSHIVLLTLSCALSAVLGMFWFKSRIKHN
ncbi:MULTISPECIES: MFS transporter [Staphylococcus]|uniref:MFS transporter n=1 Tax=Staphylococcus TaxID=1279 RepID=UPI00086CC798|nr:MFS transporter [Staphylococcus pasteuri]MCO0861672.1 MFS transporter [Staphylococcus pasteuri]ODB78504.1 MFS transporter [Staphylococcus sp. AOAB]QDW85544.1 MFS transporter [Staphylococcus pasteuri]UXR67379.1 MFS transporter [Staphylococcus pasteuri]